MAKTMPAAKNTKSKGTAKAAPVAQQATGFAQFANQQVKEALTKEIKINSKSIPLPGKEYMQYKSIQKRIGSNNKVKIEFAPDGTPKSVFEKDVSLADESKMFKARAWKKDDKSTYVLTTSYILEALENGGMVPRQVQVFLFTKDEKGKTDIVTTNLTDEVVGRDATNELSMEDSKNAIIQIVEKFGNEALK